MKDSPPSHTGARTRINKKVDALAAALANYTATDRSGDRPDLGILSGDFGIWAFLTCYQKFCGNAKLQKAYNDYTQQCFDRLCSQPAHYSHCSGIAGILSLLRLFNREKIYGSDFSELEESYRPYLLQIMQGLLDKGDWDYLHGVWVFFAVSTTIPNSSERPSTCSKIRLSAKGT